MHEENRGVNYKVVAGLLIAALLVGGFLWYANPVVDAYNVMSEFAEYATLDDDVEMQNAIDNLEEIDERIRSRPGGSWLADKTLSDHTIREASILLRQGRYELALGLVRDIEDRRAAAFIEGVAIYKQAKALYQAGDKEGGMEKVQEAADAFRRAMELARANGDTVYHKDRYNYDLVSNPQSAESSMSGAGPEKIYILGNPSDVEGEQGEDPSDGQKPGAGDKKRRG